MWGKYFDWDGPVVRILVYTPIDFLILRSSINGIVPGGLVGYPRAYTNQFRDLNSHHVHVLVHLA